MAVRPGVQQAGRVQASPPTTADCEKAYKVACYQPAQIQQAYDLPPLYVKAEEFVIRHHLGEGDQPELQRHRAHRPGYDLASGVGTVDARSFVGELASAVGR